MDYRIIPLNTGTIFVDQGVYCTMGRGNGTIVGIPSTAWYVTDGTEHILVDTGMCDTERANRWHHQAVQPEGGRIDLQLMSRAQLQPEEIDAVLFTHLHWDHCSNMKLFPNADFYVQARELEFAIDPTLPPYYRSYEAPILGIDPPFAGCDFITVDGEHSYNDAVTLFPTPGHSVGHQSVAVRTAAGTVVIAGDAVFVEENLKGDPAHMLEFLPIGRYVNYFDMWNSFKEIRKRADIVLPGHDCRVFHRKSYP
jgi:glyoxylase-like metal-dependent hydrolase (beta-lactamase superfamily II)